MEVIINGDSIFLTEEEKSHFEYFDDCCVSYLSCGKNGSKIFEESNNHTHYQQKIQISNVNFSIKEVIIILNNEICLTDEFFSMCDYLRPKNPSIYRKIAFRLGGMKEFPSITNSPCLSTKIIPHIYNPYSYINYPYLTFTQTNIIFKEKKELFKKIKSDIVYMNSYGGVYSRLELYKGGVHYICTYDGRTDCRKNILCSLALENEYALRYFISHESEDFISFEKRPIETEIAHFLRISSDQLKFFKIIYSGDSSIFSKRELLILSEHIMNDFNASSDLRAYVSSYCVIPDVSFRKPLFLKNLLRIKCLNKWIYKLSNWGLFYMRNIIIPNYFLWFIAIFLTTYSFLSYMIISVGKRNMMSK